MENCQLILFSFEVEDFVMNFTECSADLALHHPIKTKHKLNGKTNLKGRPSGKKRHPRTQTALYPL